jgi:hypothetical protein
MNTARSEVLAEISRWYPLERLERSRERWRRVWAGEDPLDRQPWVAAPLEMKYYSAGLEPAVWVDQHLAQFVRRGCIDDDFIPAFFPGCHHGAIPSLLGAPWHGSGEDTGCDRIIASIEDIARLPEPVLRPDSPAAAFLAFQRHCRQALPQFPVNIADMQGPLDVAGQLWGYDDLFLAALDEPARVDRLLTLCRQAFVRFWQEQARVCGEALVPTHLFGWNWVPPALGATLSMDSLVMISGDLFRDLVRPHLQAIAQTFGGLVIHSCGRFGHLVPELMALPGLRGINASQMSPEELVAAGADRRVVLITSMGGDRAEALAQTQRRHDLRLVPTFWLGQVGDPAALQRQAAEINRILER